MLPQDAAYYTHPGIPHSMINVLPMQYSGLINQQNNVSQVFEKLINLKKLNVHFLGAHRPGEDLMMMVISHPQMRILFVQKVVVHYHVIVEVE